MAIASLDDIMLTSPLGQYKGREGADSRKNTNSVESSGEKPTVTAGLEGEKAYWWRSPTVGRDGAVRLLPNWVGGHMSVRPLPYLEGRCKNRPTCHRRAMTGLSWSHFFCCAVQELSPAKKKIYI